MCVCNQVKAAVAALQYILQCAAKYNCDDGVLENELQQVSLVFHIFIDLYLELPFSFPSFHNSNMHVSVCRLVHMYVST